MEFVKDKFGNNRSSLLIAFLLSLTFFSCAEIHKTKEKANVKEKGKLSVENPVLPGDFADPSVVRVGDDYWATATSSEWAPLFPLLRSKNLEDWEIEGHVFPDDLPDWAEAHFWAPEIAHDNGKYYIYYTAKKKNGPLCVGVASSENATGPYKDHGPVVCQDAGAIDGFQIRDDEGKLFLIWKEDGNSRGEPTPMWGQEMNEQRTELLGERFELFRNDPETWEGNLVEGAYLLKKNGYYYTFYSGDACCGRGCTYGIGVARAKDLKGPWEKYEENPLKKQNDEWKCAGHGSMVQDEEGRYYFLYHAYSRDGSIYTGRQGLLSEVVWNENDWPEFKDELMEAADSGSATRGNFPDIDEDFRTSELSPYWQWPVGNKPDYRLEEGNLIIDASANKLGSLLAQRTVAPDFEAITEVKLSDGGVAAGLAAIGDGNNALGISVKKQEIFVWKIQNGNEEIVANTQLLTEASDLHLKLSVTEGDQYTFSWSEDGEAWEDFSKDTDPLDGAYLPPWDRAVRIGLISKGSAGSKGVFKFFIVENKN